MRRQSLNPVDPHVVKNGDVSDLFLWNCDNINGIFSTCTVLKRAVLGLI